MKGIVKWLNSIYGIRVCAPYKQDGVEFTQKENKVYTIYTYQDEN